MPSTLVRTADVLDLHIARFAPDALVHDPPADYCEVARRPTPDTAGSCVVRLRGPVAIAQGSPQLHGGNDGRKYSSIVIQDGLTRECLTMLLKYFRDAVDPRCIHAAVAAFIEQNQLLWRDLPKLLPWKRSNFASLRVLRLLEASVSEAIDSSNHRLTLDEAFYIARGTDQSEQLARFCEVASGERRKSRRNTSRGVAVSAELSRLPTVVSTVEPAPTPVVPLNEREPVPFALENELVRLSHAIEQAVQMAHRLAKIVALTRSDPGVAGKLRAIAAQLVELAEVLALPVTIARRTDGCRTSDSAGGSGEAVGHHSRSIFRLFRRRHQKFRVGG